MSNNESKSPSSGAATPGTPPRPFSFPTAFTILFGLILFVAALTWIIPAGQFDRVQNEALGKEVPVPGTYQEVEANPQRLLRSMLMAPIAGMYDPVKGEARAISRAAAPSSRSSPELCSISARKTSPRRDTRARNQTVPSTPSRRARSG